jgi:hypothetical protein
MSEGRFSLPTDFPSPIMLSRPAISQGVWEGFMALVSTIEMTRKDRQTIHRPTRCLFSVAEGPNGQRCMQFDTLGSEDRKIPDKVSQSIQFDKQAARQLLKLIQETFPDLV